LLRIAMGLKFPTEEVFPFFKTGTITSSFHNQGKVFWDSLRSKINLRAGTKILELFIKELDIPSSPSDFYSHSHIIAYEDQFEIGAKDKISVHWLTEENVPEEKLLHANWKCFGNASAISQGLIKNKTPLI
jgi:hypothetical protein